MVNVYPIAFGLAILLAGHGYRKGSLNKSGGMAAFLIGYSTMGNPEPTFGILLIGFYLAGSRATKVKAEVKATLERELKEESGVVKVGSGRGQDQEKVSKHKSSTGGQRDALQVLCNSFTSGVAALAYRLLFSGEIDSSTIINGSHSVLGKIGFETPEFLLNAATLRNSGWCPLDSKVGSGVPRHLLLVAIGHFCCCMGDTLASELGILSKIQPVLVINPLRKVPPGTNGGITPFGTLCSLLGGTFIGLLSILSLSFSCSTLPASTLATLLLLASFSGFLGSMIDSVLGATFQKTWYSKKTKQVLLGRLSESEQKKRVEEDWKVITGADVMSNNQVNFISSLCTGILTAYLGSFLP